MIFFPIQYFNAHLFQDGSIRFKSDTNKSSVDDALTTNVIIEANQGGSDRGIAIMGRTYTIGIAAIWQNLFEFSVPVIMNSSLRVDGTKSRNVETKSYTNRLLYSYETPTPMFGDIGEAVLDEEGICYVDIDDIFTETIAEQVEYQVFLQKEGEGDAWIADKGPRYFIIEGTPNLKVAWELKAKQRDYETYRLEPSDTGLDEHIDPEDPLGEIDAYINEQEALLYG